MSDDRTLLERGTVTRIRFMSAQRPQPKIGDRRTTKAHGEQIRVVVTSGGAWCVRGSRYVYEWRSPESLRGTQWEYLLTADERNGESQ